MLQKFIIYLIYFSTHSCIVFFLNLSTCPRPPIPFPLRTGKTKTTIRSVLSEFNSQSNDDTRVLRKSRFADNICFRVNDDCNNTAQ